jgi:hypothetical protein
MDILTYLNEGTLIIVAVLLVLGKIIKTIPGIPNWVIPIVLMVPGVIGTMAIYGWTGANAIQGILAVAVAVYGNQLYKQLLEGTDTNKSAG